MPLFLDPAVEVKEETSKSQELASMTKPPPTDADHAFAHINICISAIKCKNSDDAFFNLPPSTPFAAMAVNQKLNSMTTTRFFDEANMEVYLSVFCNNPGMETKEEDPVFVDPPNASDFPKNSRELLADTGWHPEVDEAVVLESKGHVEAAISEEKPFDEDLKVWVAGFVKVDHDMLFDLIQFLKVRFL